MADVRYYKKFSPDTRIQLPNGQFLQAFGVPYAGSITGYWATNNEGLQQFFGSLISKGQYGLSEISWDEFNKDYVEKKNQPAKPIWREELGRNSVGSASAQEPAVRLAEEGRLNAVAVKGCDQPGKPACGLTMAEAPAAAAGRQTVENASVASALEKKPTPAAGRRAKAARLSSSTPTPQPPAE